MTLTAEEQYELGQDHYYGRNAPQDYTEAAKWYRLAADHGLADAQYSLGFLYQCEVEMSRDFAEASKWYRLAADQGHAIAMSNLGGLYEWGNGVSQDYNEAFKWYHLAADQGLAEAQYNLGALYDRGKGVSQDHIQALKWFSLAADQGAPDAMMKLGDMYENGQGVPQDVDEAVKWIRRAAAQGDVYGMAELGRILAADFRAPSVFAEAVYWYRKAVENGEWGSTLELAMLTGLVADNPKSISEAYFWRSLNNALFPDEIGEEEQEMEEELKSSLSKAKSEETQSRVWEMWNRLTNNGMDLSMDLDSLKILKEKDGRLQHGLHVGDADWANIPSGEFTMGGAHHLIRKTRKHQVCVNGFQMLKTPVTFAMYDAYCRAKGIAKPDDSGWGRGCQPVINVSYWDAVNYIKWLNEQTGWHCRLPTEAEWEYACRAGTTTPFWTGKSINQDQANFRELDDDWKKRSKTTPVDFFAPNPWGLHDMTGNVHEWCASLYDMNYTGMETQDATGQLHFKKKLDSLRVLRGGGAGNSRDGTRSAHRWHYYPDDADCNIGFRLARDL